MNPKLPQFEVVIEIPCGSFLKRGWDGSVDFISPFPCPFNYGSIPDYIGCEGDFLDAVVLGPRLTRGKIVSVIAQGAVGLRAYPPACKPYGLYGLEAAPEGGRADFLDQTVAF